MALLVPNQAEHRMISMIVNATTAQNQNLSLRLFKNNITPASTDVLADYTESTFTGYAAVTLTSGSWTVTAATSGAPATATQTSATTFTCTGTTSELTYGYYLLQTAGTGLMWAERFSDGPYTIANNGDKVILTPSITLSTT
jgi:hypothetical protein